MEPRFVGVKVVLVKSFARIHETNLKKQGVLALTFHDKSDYDKIEETDAFSIENILNIRPNEGVELTINHKNGDFEKIITRHTLNENQIEWIMAGSALNLIAKQENE